MILSYAGILAQGRKAKVLPRTAIVHLRLDMGLAR